jgi:hypothetical protein
MADVVKVVRLSLGVLAVVLGLAALGLAHDIRAWDRGVAGADARFVAQPAGVRWGAATWLPPDVSLRTLGLRDDPALRRAEQAFVVAAAAPMGYDNGIRRTRLRALGELALSDVVASGSPAQASRAGNLVGILAATANAKDGVTADERQAADAFDAAIRADPTNADAKRNLELLLRRVKVVGTREGAGGSSGYFGHSLPGAGAGLPGSGY